MSASAPYPKEMNGQTKSCFGILMNMTRAPLTTSGLPKTFWHLIVKNATYLKNRLPRSALGDRLPYRMVFGYNPDVSTLRIFRSLKQAFLPPQERGGKLANRTRAGRYAGHDAGGSTCINLDEKTNAFTRNSLSCLPSWGGTRAERGNSPNQSPAKREVHIYYYNIMIIIAISTKHTTYTGSHEWHKVFECCLRTCSSIEFQAGQIVARRRQMDYRGARGNLFH